MKINLNNPCIIYLVSDSSGETVQSITKASMAQFPNVKFEICNYALVKNTFRLDEVIEIIKYKPGLIYYSLVDSKINNILKKFIIKNNIVAIDILSEPVAILENTLNIKPTGKIGAQHTMDLAYFNRISAMQYAQKNDDGQNLDDIYSADIVILGVSRTSKTPTCMYLANKGYFVANIPIIYGIPIDIRIMEVVKKKSVFMIGLYMDVKHLVSIRKKRILGFKQSEKYYSEYSAITKEIVYAKKLFNELGIASVNITSISIEETAAMIISRMDKN